MIGSGIEHDDTLPWGWWMRTSNSSRRSAVIIDEFGQEWQSLRQAFWCGRLGMSSDNEGIVDENLELMLAVLISKTGGVVPMGEDVHGLFEGSASFYRWYIYWLQAAGLLVRPPSRGPFEAGTTAEGASVVRMLLATRPAELASIPVGAAALRAFGPADTRAECNRDSFTAGDGGSAAYPYAVIREDRFRRHLISVLHRDLNDTIPMARTIWSITCPDQESRNRLFSWMHDRVHRWSSWGEKARTLGAEALSQHLLSLVALDPTFGSATDGKAHLNAKAEQKSTHGNLTISAVTPGPATERGRRYKVASVELPVVLLAALEVAGISVEAFLSRLDNGAIWQDEAILSPNRDVEIQAHLASMGLRCVVRIGASSWYHHPSDTLHVFGATMPADLEALGPIIGHPLLDPLPIRVLDIGDLNSAKPDLGICVSLDVPCVRYPLPHIPPARSQ